MNTAKLVRDERTRALLNTNNDELRAYRIRRVQATRLETLENDINSVRQDIQDIKNLLLEITNRG